MSTYQPSILCLGKFDARTSATVHSSTKLRSGPVSILQMTGMAEELGRDPYRR